MNYGLDESYSMTYTIKNAVRERELLMNRCLFGTMRKVILTVLVGFLALYSVAAYQFSPLEQSFQPTGAESTKTYTIVNDSNDSIAISISALIRDQDAQGNEVNTPADAYFSIVPNKLVGLLRAVGGGYSIVGPRTSPMNSRSG